MVVLLGHMRTLAKSSVVTPRWSHNLNFPNHRNRILPLEIYRRARSSERTEPMCQLISQLVQGTPFGLPVDPDLDPDHILGEIKMC